eukprot:5909790-Prymnesium_polylepis.1
MGVTARPSRFDQRFGSCFCQAAVADSTRQSTDIGFAVILTEVGVPSRGCKQNVGVNGSYNIRTRHGRWPMLSPEA